MMDQAKALAQQQQQLLLQQLQYQKQQQSMSRLPSNTDAHLLTLGNQRPMLNPNLHQQPNPNRYPNSVAEVPNQNQLLSPGVSEQPQQQHQTIGIGRRPPANQTELQLAYQDAWRVCHPDFRRAFESIEDACERLLPYHVVADYEAEEDDKILDSDTTGLTPTRSQQWDNNIASKVADFAGTYEKQTYTYNVISRKRGQGEFRAEERLMIEQALLQEEKRAIQELRTEKESMEKAGLEAKMKMVAMAQASHAQSQVQSHAEMMARGALRATAIGYHSSEVSTGHNMRGLDHGGNPEGMMNGWGNNGQRDDVPADYFSNDEENGNGDTGDELDRSSGNRFEF